VISLEEESQTRGPIEPNCLTYIYFLLGCAQADHLCAAWIQIAVLFQFLSCFLAQHLLSLEMDLLSMDVSTISTTDAIKKFQSFCHA